jgi:hypothetical protein
VRLPRRPAGAIARDVGGAVDVSAAAGTGGSDAGGAAGAPVTCVPGTSTEPVGTGSLLDRKTCLVWQNAVAGMMTNKQAALHCSELTQDGFSDWRVPTPEELATWPKLAVDSNAYVTNPTYIPVTAPTVQDGCTGNSHSCNLTHYNAGSLACAWQGVGFVGPFVCVRGTATPGSIPPTYAATTCDSCRTHLTGATADFKVAGLSAVRALANYRRIKSSS